MTDAKNFASAEHLWFWFISSRRLQTGFSRKGNGVSDRPCELIDIETMITGLYLTGKLSVKQLEVLKHYGEARRIPGTATFGERKDAEIWDDAITTITAECKKRKWVD